MINNELFKSKLLPIYMLVIAFLLYSRDIMNISINKDIFLLIVLSFSLIVKYDNLISLILYTLPLMVGLPGNYFLPVWGILVVYYQIRRNSLNYYALFFWIIICVWELIIYSFYVYTVDIPVVIGYFSALLLASLLIAEKRTINYKQSLFSFCFGCCVLLSIIVLIYINNPMLMESGKRRGGDFYIEESVMTLKANSNVVAYFSIALAVFSFVLYYYKIINIYSFSLFVIVSFISGFFAMSRTWGILMILLIILYIFFLKKNKKTGYLLIAFLFLVCGYYLYNNPLMLDSFVQRFTDANVRNAGNRTILYDQYNEFFFSNIGNMLFGTSALMYKDVTGIYNSTHNCLQQIWLSYGVIGFIFILISVLRIFYNNFMRLESMAYLPFIILFLFLQTIQILNPYNGIYPIIASFFILKMIKSDQLIKNK